MLFGRSISGRTGHHWIVHGEVELSAVWTSHLRKYWTVLDCSWRDGAECCLEVASQEVLVTVGVRGVKQLQSRLQKHYAQEVFKIFVVQHLTQFD